MGINDEYNRVAIEYVSLMSALELLAMVEQVPEHFAARWLLEKEAHLHLTIYDPQSETPTPYGIGFGVFAGSPEFPEITLETVLRAIAEPGSCHPVDAAAYRIGNRLYFGKDEFWRFVLDHGADITVEWFSRFTNDDDVPSFWQDEWHAVRSRENNSGAHAAHSRLQAMELEVKRLTHELATATAEIATLRDQLSGASAQRNAAAQDSPTRILLSPGSRNGRHWTRQDLQVLLEARRGGAKVAELAASYGITPQRISTLIKKAESQERIGGSVTSVWHYKRR
ncbi:hypothetical protein PMO31116_02677 [Pandoraea morbifera]|uniref:Uncharacterized protein n=1 Tax=Pandoraea morbifera TaxID=2508300 RepID=A0A5E4VJE6_9BURK|nr:MarR family transcriptional regulator [Pandoraea morbifera]VVE12417.1 hypothetical protein PMO31116_02677 [Pandoraea morbifera]